MSKSIKLKDDTYIDSKGISHNKEKLSDILENITEILASNFAKRLDFLITDKQTQTIEIQHNRVYLFINCHTYQRCMLFITTYSGGLHVDTIFKSSDTAVPTITMEGTNLTITMPHQARGFLYSLKGLWCS